MKEKPVRIQLRRTKGWRMPASAVKVCRPGKWGNPYKVCREFRCDSVFMAAITQQEAVDLFRKNITERIQNFPSILEEMKWELGGFDLACWCRLDQPCHADVLLELANA